MPALLSPVANEKSTYVIEASFKDEFGTAVVPTSIIWTLTDTNGVVINSRTAVSVTPAETITIVLSGADLAFTGVINVYRDLTIKAVYNSTMGTALPLNSSIRFLIQQLIAVS